jgi:dienelactone hydrolase
MRYRLSLFTPLSLPVIFLSLNLAVISAQTTPAISPSQSANGVSPESSLQPNTVKEDWTVLPLAGSGLSSSAINAELLGKYDQPDYTRELWRVQWRPDDPIDLYIVLPHGVTKPRAILYLYDYRFDTDRFRDEGWCTRATQGGFAAIGFVSALSGQRFHSPRPMKEWFVSQLQEALGSSTHDVQMTLNYLASRGDIDVDQTGIFAQGSGGTIAVLAAQADSRIVALDLLNPWGDWPDWLKDSPQIPEEERPAYLKPGFLDGVSSLDPVTYLPKLHVKTLRIQQSLDDSVTPAAARDKIAAAVPNKENVIRYTDTTQHLNAWRQTGLTAWIKQQLRPSSNVAVAGNQ